STAAMVDGSSHSANASLLLSCSSVDADSGFSLYARPIRMWSRVTSYKKRPLVRSVDRNALSSREYERATRCAIGNSKFFFVASDGPDFVKLDAQFLLLVVRGC